MTTNTARKTLTALALGAVTLAGLAGTAHADERKGDWMEIESFSLDSGAGGGGGGGGTCWDWTNEDGTTGTECTAVVVLRWEKLRVP